MQSIVDIENLQNTYVNVFTQRYRNSYVNNALHGHTLANCSHFQYVSRLRLRVIWIGVKACIDVTLYDELFIISITEHY